MNLRLLALAGVAACAVALPLAVASAGPVDDEERADVHTSRTSVRPSVSPSPPADAKAPSAAPGRSPLLLGLGPAAAARCGPELTSPEGIEAQTCVLTQGEETWARTYYRNATGSTLDSVLSLMGPAGRTVQMRCVVDAEDEPGTCETPRERTQGDLAAYTAVAEFAAHAGQGPLLLRSGSNSPVPTGS
ncbi:hypothetical protein [Streptomyces dysideae]|uniref:Serine/threonine protein kinase n=1 Tax=Streptomyces dysideae TaxID=909626 RepID=A0A101V2K7_9ACTN|nr:hypothetical protein [Streptomyces dysideae]KUO21370.1 hypothetical protein AQJ91_08435 [Streptomyces dysideae]